MKPSQTQPSGGIAFGWVVVAALAVLALVGGYFLARTLTGDDAPDAPTGLVVEVEPGRTVATWTRVDGADAYQLLRGDLVVYSGPDTEAVDATVTEGRHIYRVQAVRDGMTSAPGNPVQVVAGPGWGTYAPQIALFGDLLPSAPNESGWEGTACVPMLSGTASERGPSEIGSGDLQTVMRLRCATLGYRNSFALTWWATEDARNAAFADFAPAGRPVSWAHGTGVIDPAQGRAMFKIADDPARELVTIVVISPGATRLSPEQLVDFVDSMPL